MSPNKPDKTTEYHRKILHILEKFMLVGISIATVFAAGADMVTVFEHGRVTLADLLLMFIYLEVLAMITHYFDSGQLPVRFPLYIGIVALARYLILDMKELDDWRIVSITGAILILAIAVLVIRFGHCKFPYQTGSKSCDNAKE